MSTRTSRRWVRGMSCTTLVAVLALSGMTAGCGGAVEQSKDVVAPNQMTPEKQKQYADQMKKRGTGMPMPSGR